MYRRITIFYPATTFPVYIDDKYNSNLEKVPLKEFIPRILFIQAVHEEFFVVYCTVLRRIRQEEQEEAC